MRNLFRPSLATLALVSVFCSPDLHAAALVYEPFDMATGDLDGGSSTGSAGLSSSWNATVESTGNHQVTSTPALNYGDLAHSGNYLYTAATNGSTDGDVRIDSSLSNAGLLADGESLWFSVIIDGAVASNAHSGFGFGAGTVFGQYNGLQNTADGVGIYFKGGSYQAVVWEGGGGTRTIGAGSLSGTGPSLLVGELSWTASGETLSLYMPSLTDLGTLGTPVTVSTAGNVDQTSFDTISYSTRGDGEGSNNIFDEIRFGASYADVAPVPEPSAALLGSLAFLGLLRRRR